MNKEIKRKEPIGNKDKRNFRCSDEDWNIFTEKLENNGDMTPSFALRLFIRMVNNGSISIIAPGIIIGGNE